MIKPVKVVVNGRISNQFGEFIIDVEGILTIAIKKYLSRVLPNLNSEKEVEIIVNSTQNSLYETWFAPRNVNDIPDAFDPILANDTSAVTSFYPFTLSEKLAYELEHYFWEYDAEKYPVPKFKYFGQISK